SSEMSSIQESFKAGQARGTGEAKAEQIMESGRNAASTATQSAREGTEKASGFLHQTGEQVASMAQGAVETLKNTLGRDNSSGNTPSSNAPGSKLEGPSKGGAGDEGREEGDVTIGDGNEVYFGPRRRQRAEGPGRTAKGPCRHESGGRSMGGDGSERRGVGGGVVDGDMSDVEGTRQEGNESATWAMLQDMMTAHGLANAHVGEDSSYDPPPIPEQPNLEAKKIFKLVEDAQIKLYPAHELWRLTHQKKDGSWGSEYSRQVYETVRDKLEESSSQSCSLAAPTPDEVLTSIVGQRSGHIRGRGCGLRPTLKSVVTAATIAGFQAQVKNKDEEISQMKEMISKQCEDMAVIQEKLENQREELTTHLENMMNQRFMDMMSQFQNRQL
ncbi:hypothetical protein Taro_042691, partial [Colocasia esculenta]|nr:hypothetical protein [Colocasia esculenta]